jgi:quinol monooxygenase YgiN
MAPFIQVIEYTTSKHDEMMKFVNEWRATHPDRGYDWLVVGADRDKPGAFVTVVRFSSYEQAMKNNEDPATQEFSERMAQMTDAPPVFRNLDVMITEGA